MSEAFKGVEGYAEFVAEYAGASFCDGLDRAHVASREPNVFTCEEVDVTRARAVVAAVVVFAAATVGGAG